MPSSFDADFKINPGFSICNKTSADLLIALVISSADNFETRENIRSKWFNLIEYPKIRRIFLVGLSQSQSINEKIEAESNQFNDIVQGMFIDSYYNLTLKTLTGFRWASIYCSNSIFTLKVDDDVLVNSNKLISYLEAFYNNNGSKKSSNTIFGRLVAGASPNRNNNSKFYLSKLEYSEDSFKNYLAGPAYMFTSDFNGRLYETSLHVKKLKFEDVYVGMLLSYLSHNLKINLIDIKKFCFEHESSYNIDNFENNFDKYQSYLFIWSP